MKEIYLDNSATTALCPEAKAQMLVAMEEYGNPSSLHTVGVRARTLLENARAQVAAALGVRDPKPGQLIFTSCGSEASNLAILGGLASKTRRTATRVLTTDSEHPSVENVMQKLEGEGYEVVRIATRGGVLDMEQVDAACNAPIALVSMMLVNNETGARYDVESVFRKVREKNPEALLHCDAVQGFMKQAKPLAGAGGLGADLITVSAHKIHGPKGVGALFVGQNVLKTKHLVPTLLGGGQENGFRSGTENVVGIVGFGAAAEAARVRLGADLAHVEGLRERAIEELGALGLQLNLPAGAHAPHILNLTLPGIKSETMLHFLSSKGICVSAGSACSAHARHPSRALLSFGLDAAAADTSLRVSLCAGNTEADVDALRDALAEGLATLVRIRR